MRSLAYLTGHCLFAWLGASTLLAAEADAKRYQDAADKLIVAINANDQAAIQGMFNQAMQQALPAEKTGPFFAGVLAAKGKLRSAGEPEIKGPTATIEVTAERGNWVFEVTLDPADKITGLRVLPGADKSGQKEAEPAAGQRFTDATAKLIAAINADDQAAIQAMLDEAMQTALPADKSASFFRGVLSGKGKLQTGGAPEISGPGARIRVTAERGDWVFELALDPANKIAGLRIVPSDDKPSGKDGDKLARNESVPRSRMPMRLPFREQWHVFWGGDSEAVNAHARVPNQRRAGDLIILDASGKSHQGAGRRNEDYYCYGKELLAAAPGTVVTAIDGVPDNMPGTMNPVVLVGNCLIIDHGNNEFAVYAHLQPGSLRVKKGDKAKAGQVIGLCGNSGNSSEPHLHFHLQDSELLQDGQGITPYFRGVQCERAGAKLTVKEYTFQKGDNIEPAGGK